MKISIITVNLNNHSGLQDTINSIRNQSNRDFEYLVIDGGSTDGSVELIKANTNYIHYWVSEKDTGIYNAMNKGIRKSTGDYLIFLNSGDSLYSNDIIERCYNFYRLHPGKDIYYGDMFCINDKARAENWLCRHPKNLTLVFFHHHTINHQASLIKSSLFSEYGLYPEKYKLASDIWMFLKCIVDHKKFEYLDFTVVNYDYSGASNVGMDIYQKEKRLIWKDVVPKPFLDTFDELEEHRRQSNFTIVRKAKWLNQKLQILKNLKFFK